jgi:ribosomal protein S18 acetylase RimI-like enzyme
MAVSSDSDVRPLDAGAEALACAQLMVTSDPWITLGLSRDTALAVLTDPAREAYKILDEQGVAGFAVLDMRGLTRGYIQILCVRPDRRRQGLGSRLIRWSEDRIFRESPNAFICVSSFNPDAQRLYERLGFSTVGVLPDFIVPGHDEILLRKTTGAWAEFRRSEQKRFDA